MVQEVSPSWMILHEGAVQEMTNTRNWRPESGLEASNSLQVKNTIKLDKKKKKTRGKRRGHMEMFDRGAGPAPLQQGNLVVHRYQSHWNDDLQQMKL